ncbi:sporangia-induced kinesin-like protein [Plasmopara halstedii]|uniref:Kinesin-like protein n=1 Tax=Plasmopara halstedii TaxID=4781 RepID=A0A0P1B4I8_PLAHL|nr:sporangia-induced kinesin-like protein [Plasmopara halstedii]CEG49703.1 sporangia-induced kinesin-like protein [Plasmopara halstedii]|eukprot:XP_024586072.1 sporangia-induced kinesin-like protein [Plasmopara halstedii]
MESRSSFRQLHQQLGDLTLSGHTMAGVIRTRSGHGIRNNAVNWNLSNPRLHPSLPSLPQCTASSNQLMYEEVRKGEGLSSAPQAGEWNMLSSSKMPMNQTTTNGSDVIENQRHQENEGLEISRRSSENVGFENVLNGLTSNQEDIVSKPTSSRLNSSSSTVTTTTNRFNEDEDIMSSGSCGETNQQEETCRPHHTPIRGQFFRSWKKDTNDDDSYSSEDWSLPSTNKWKDRAIVDPFAKRRARDRKMKPIQKIPDVLPPPSRAIDQRIVRSPVKSSKKLLESASTRSASPLNSAELAPLKSLRLTSADRNRATKHLRPVPPLSNVSSARPLRLCSAQGNSRESLCETNDDTAELTTTSRQSRGLTKTSQHRTQSTVSALNEIKRKREARRARYAVERQRVEKEVREYGDDAGYKFRRLIQQYRDALSPTQLEQLSHKELPLLEHHGSMQPPPTPTLMLDCAETARLSVFIRKRPLAKKELKSKGYDIVSCLFASEDLESKRNTNALLLRRDLVCHEPKLRVDCSATLENHHFHFDGVFDELQENVRVYDATVGPMIPYLVSKATASGPITSLTVFAYGQTGSGKTYTMKSIYRQAASALFQQIDALNEMSSYRQAHVCVGISFYEIYMNNVNDLLNGRSRVQLMENGDGAVQLPGLKEIRANNADELLTLVQLGEQARATSANAVHDDSSRSHALLQVTLYAEDNNVVVARLYMVDLAGSERASDTQSDKKNTRMEGAEINKSLLALKECIRALDRGALHIPFRQSKLTQLLRDSFLSQDSKTIMIATVSPCSESCNHTLNTLRYADRLKEIGAVN